MGQVFCDARRFNDGVAVLTEAVKRYGGEPQVLLYLGRCQAGANQDVVAIDLLNRACNLAREKADKALDPQRKAQWLALADELS